MLNTSDLFWAQNVISCIFTFNCLFYMHLYIYYLYIYIPLVFTFQKKGKK